jgi:hypothetical protein
MELLNIKKPCSVQIKVIEAIGIIMRVPYVGEKSKFKAASPTNYDGTVDLLGRDFEGVMKQLSTFIATELPNDIAKKLYAKTLEPGFSYEDAVLFSQSNISLLLRDLFNSLILIIQGLQDDPVRIPVKQENVLILVDASRASYVAMDLGSHIFNHGMCTFGVLKIRDRMSREEEMLCDHIPQDVERRCRQQYKLPEHYFQIKSLSADTITDTVDVVRDCMEETQSTTLVLGVDVNTWSDPSNLRDILQWALWETGSLMTVMLAKSCSITRPFTSLRMPRTFLAYCSSEDDLLRVSISTLKFMNPDDTLLIYAVSEPREPIGDSYDTRFELGAKKNCWLRTYQDLYDEKQREESGSHHGTSDLMPSYPGWNDDTNTALQQAMDTTLKKSKVQGSTRIDFRDNSKSMAQQIMQYVFQERVDVVVMERALNIEVAKELCQDAKCAVALI